MIKLMYSKNPSVFRFFFSFQKDVGVLMGRKSSNLKMGIVGIANVTFNILTKQRFLLKNFPFIQDNETNSKSR